MRRMEKILENISCVTLDCKAERKGIQRIINTAQRIIGCPLPSRRTFTTPAASAELRTLKKTTLTLVPTRLTCCPNRYRCIKSRTNTQGQLISQSYNHPPSYSVQYVYHISVQSPFLLQCFFNLYSFSAVQRYIPVQYLHFLVQCFYIPFLIVLLRARSLTHISAIIIW